MNASKRPVSNYLVAPATLFTFFLILSTFFWLLENNLMLFLNFLFIGIFTSGGMLLYAWLPKKRKIIGRRVAFYMVGLSLFLGVGIFGRVNMQIEGLFFYLVAGSFSGVLTHYLVAKILGPVIIHRSWCSWGCWSMMIFDLLPYKNSKGWLPGKWKWFRYVHFGLSLSLILILSFGFSYSLHMESDWYLPAMYWFIGGNVLYYGLGIVLIFMLKDNRAFCKYACPITPFLKLSGPLSILKIEGEKEVCTECGTCTKKCPMNIRIPEYVKEGSRILSNECVLCLSCIGNCPENTLRTSLKLDRSYKNLLVSKIKKDKAALDN